MVGYLDDYDGYVAEESDSDWGKGVGLIVTRSNQSLYLCPLHCVVGNPSESTSIHILPHLSEY